MLIHFIRHAQTENNLNRIVQSRTDSRLSDIGYRQSLELKQRLSKITFTNIITSTSQRTFDTVSNIQPEIVRSQSLDIIELDMGLLESTKIDERFDDLIFEKVTNCNTYQNKQILSETILSVEYRLIRFLQNLYYTNDNILVCSHGFTLSVLRSLLTNQSTTFNLVNHKPQHCHGFIVDIISPTKVNNLSLF